MLIHHSVNLEAVTVGPSSSNLVFIPHIVLDSIIKNHWSISSWTVFEGLNQTQQCPRGGRALMV